MTWARSIELLDFEVRGWLYPDELSLIYRTDCSRRTALLERRLELARLESAEWRHRAVTWEAIHSPQPGPGPPIFLGHCAHRTDEAERVAVAATPAEEV